MRARGIAAVMGGAALLVAQAAAAQPAVQQLGADFWAWRGTTQPASSDDIPRIVRPAGWVPDWSPAGVAAQRRQLAAFEARWQALEAAPRTVAEKVDYRLVGSALARVHWEMDHVAAWRRQPHFYTAQALNPVFEVLLPPPPVARPRLEEVIRLLANAPAILAAGRANLDDLRGPFVDVALSQLAEVPESLRGMAAGLDAYADAGQKKRLKAVLDKAIAAFADYAAFLKSKRAGLSEQTAVGRESYRYFLGNVGIYPYTPEQLVAMGRQEWARSVLFETLERNRNAGLPELPIGPSIGAVTARLDAEELKVRRFLTEKNLLTVPGWVGHYKAQPFPAYLAPIGWLGRTFDFTSIDRTGQDATVYLPDPSPKLGYFNLSIMRDPRPIIVHEGVPGHFFQLSLSWRNPDPLRRRYYDSGANEGTGFYAEEMMLQAGFWADAPKTREIIYNFARLRALRVEVDVKLALGEFTIAQAADYLERMVPMDRATAREEATFFAAAPGQAISYQIGKMQTTEFLAEARVREGKSFDLKRFHDYLWTNGNVPIALQKEEYLSMVSGEQGQTGGMLSMDLVIFTEPKSGLSARCRLLPDAAPQSCDFLRDLATRRASFEAMHAIWTGPEISVPMPSAALPQGMAQPAIPAENATSYPGAGDVVLAYLAPGSTQGLPPGPFYDIGIFYGAGGRLLMPFGWIQANVCARILPEDLDKAVADCRTIRRNGACTITVEPA